MFTQTYSMKDVQVPAMRVAFVVEPIMELAALYSKYLQEQQLVVQVCASANELLQAASQARLDILVYNLEVGVETLTQLKQKNPALIIITLSDDPSDQRLDALMKLGVSGHINRKVTTPKDIGLLVGQLLQY